MNRSPILVIQFNQVLQGRLEHFTDSKLFKTIDDQKRVENARILLVNLFPGTPDIQMPGTVFLDFCMIIHHKLRSIN